MEQAFLPVVNGAHLRTLVSRSTAAAPNGIPGRSTQSRSIQGATHGTTLYSATLLGSTDDVLSWQGNAYDDKNRLRSTLSKLSKKPVFSRLFFRPDFPVAY